MGSTQSTWGARKMGKDGGNFITDLVLGGVSGAIVKTAMAPIERVKILMRTQDSNPKVLSGEIPKYTGIGDCFARVNAEQGPKAFWRGNLVNCIRYAPQQGSALAFNDAIKRAFPKYNPKTHYYPFDTVRRRMMLDSEKPAAERLYRSGIHCFTQVMKKEGFGGMYKGLVPELVRGLGGPLVLTAYDRIKLWLNI